MALKRATEHRNGISHGVRGMLVRASLGSGGPTPADQRERRPVTLPKLAFMERPLPKSMTDPIPRRGAPPMAVPIRPYSTADIDTMRRMAAEGSTNKAIAAALGRSPGSVSNKRYELGVHLARTPAAARQQSAQAGR